MLHSNEVFSGKYLKDSIFYQVLPTLNAIIDTINTISIDRFRDDVMLGFTHGQPAVPTTHKIRTASVAMHSCTHAPMQPCIHASAAQVACIHASMPAWCRMCPTAASAKLSKR